MCCIIIASGIIVLTLIVAIVLCFGYHYDNASSCESFINRSMYGYKYDTVDLRFVSAKDRKLAHDTLITQMSKEGVTYSNDDLVNVSDSLVLQLLETDDDDDSLTALKAKLRLLVTPQYKAAYKVAIAGRKNGFKLDSAESRKMIYSLIVKYFTSLSTKYDIATINDWTDSLLIQTIMTLQYPNQNSFAKSKSDSN